MKTCSRCLKELPLDQFYKNRRLVDGLTVCCKDCTYVPKIARHGDLERRTVVRQEKLQALEELKETSREARKGAARLRALAREQVWRAKKKAAKCCTSCGATDVVGTRCEPCKAHRKALYSKKYKERYHGMKTERRSVLRQAVFDLLGNKCACCGETGVRFLTLDHSKNDGGRERNQGRKMSMMRGVLAGERHDIQILCFNCNCGKELNSGVCPHKEGA